MAYGLIRSFNPDTTSWDARARQNRTLSAPGIPDQPLVASTIQPSGIRENGSQPFSATRNPWLREAINRRVSQNATSARTAPGYFSTRNAAIAGLRSDANLAAGASGMNAESPSLSGLYPAGENLRAGIARQEGDTELHGKFLGTYGQKLEDARARRLEAKQDRQFQMDYGLRVTEAGQKAEENRIRQAELADYRSGQLGLGQQKADWQQEYQSGLLGAKDKDRQMRWEIADAANMNRTQIAADRNRAVSDIAKEKTMAGKIDKWTRAKEKYRNWLMSGRIAQNETLDPAAMQVIKNMAEAEYPASMLAAMETPQPAVPGFLSTVGSAISGLFGGGQNPAAGAANPNPAAVTTAPTQSAVSSDDVTAKAWALANPNDPRAQTILSHLQAMGY